MISAPACSAPPPPNGMPTNFAGSWPRSIETSRIAPAMRASATRTMASAAAMHVEAERLADMRHGSPACAASTSSRASLPPIGWSALMRPSTTWASVRVGRSLPWP